MGKAKGWVIIPSTLIQGSSAFWIMLSVAVLGIKGISWFAENAPCALPQTSMVTMNRLPSFGSSVDLKLTGEDRLKTMLIITSAQVAFMRGSLFDLTTFVNNLVEGGRRTLLTCDSDGSIIKLSTFKGKTPEQAIDAAS